MSESNAAEAFKKAMESLRPGAAAEAEKAKTETAADVFKTVGDSLRPAEDKKEESTAADAFKKAGDIMRASDAEKMKEIRRLIDSLGADDPK